MTGQLMHTALIGIFSFGLLQGLYLTVFLLAYKRRKRSDRLWLAALMAALSATILCQFLSITGLYLAVFPVFLVLSGSIFLVGPLFYLYVRKLAVVGSSPAPGFFWHFLPFTANTVLLLVLNGVAHAELTGQVQEPFSEGQTAGISWYPLVKTMYMLVYGILTLKLLLDHQKRLKNRYSAIEKLDLFWLRWLATAYSAILGCLVVLHLLAPVLDSLMANSDSLLVILITLIIFGIGHLWLRYPELLGTAEPLPEPEDEPVPEDETELGDRTRSAKEPTQVLTESDKAVPELHSGRTMEARYRDSRLKRDESAALAERVGKYMASEHPYLETELKLAGLALRIRMKPHELSQVINENFGQNFFDYINAYRVEHAKRLLVANHAGELNILDIAFESGFNSKAAFNRAFLKHARTTPSRFRTEPKMAGD